MRSWRRQARAAALRLRIAVAACNLSVGRVPGSAVHPDVEARFPASRRRSSRNRCERYVKPATRPRRWPCTCRPTSTWRFSRRDSDAEAMEQTAEACQVEPRRALRPGGAERDAAAATDGRQLRAPRHAARALQPARSTRSSIPIAQEGRARAQRCRCAMRRRRGRRPPRCTPVGRLHHRHRGGDASATPRRPRSPTAGRRPPAGTKVERATSMRSATAWWF